VAVIIALGQLRVDTRILNILTIVILSGASLAFALTFGLGTRDTTRNLIAGFYARRLFGAGEDLELAGERGTLRSISATQTVLESAGMTVAVPNSTFLEQVIRRREGSAT
jgi:small-conductance mechanosensitive channel